MKPMERILDVINERWKEAVVALLVLSFPFTAFYACKIAVIGCVKIEEVRDKLGCHDKYYQSFDELDTYSGDVRSAAERLEANYGLILPESAELIYARDHGFWNSSETFFMFRLCPREIEGYREGMDENDVLGLITNDKYARINGFEVEINAKTVERETLPGTPMYGGTNYEFRFMRKGDIRFMCDLYCTEADPNEMIFALAYKWG